jgi:hypothetical protein
VFLKAFSGFLLIFVIEKYIKMIIIEEILRKISNQLRKIWKNYRKSRILWKAFRKNFEKKILSRSAFFEQKQLMASAYL